MATKRKVVRSSSAPAKVNSTPKSSGSYLALNLGASVGVITLATTEVASDVAFGYQHSRSPAQRMKRAARVNARRAAWAARR
jgi:hypothetical protein